MSKEIRPRIYPPAIASERVLEQQRRYQSARSRALIMLKTKYQDDYKYYLGLASKHVDNERGPLPGDEVTA